MTKNILISLALTTALVAENSPFNGFYFGINGGVVETKTSLKATDERFNLGPTGVHNFQQQNKKYKKETNFAYGLMTGYGMTIDDIYVGAEFGISDDNADRKIKYEYQSKSNANIKYGATIQYKRGIVFSFAPRLGYIVDKCWMMYVKPAIEISQDKIKQKDAWVQLNARWDNFDLNDPYKKKIITTFAPSLGIEKAFTKNVIGRLEYTYNFGGKLKDGTDHIKYESHALKFGMAYKF